MRELPDIVEAYVAELKGDARLLDNMAGIYPGDPTGNLSRDAFILRAMADLLSDANWFEALMEFESKHPVIEVAVDNV